MKYQLIKIIGIFLMLNLMINGVSGSNYVDDADIYYSQKLKAGMEFTWEFVRFNFEFNDTDGNAPGLNQATSTVTSVVSSEVNVTSTVTVTTTTTYQATTTYDETVTVSEENEGPEFPEIPPGSKYNVKLLKDLGDLSQRQYWDNYGSDPSEYYEASFASPELNDEEFFEGLNLFIEPSEIRFANGTELNYFEYLVIQTEREREEYTEEFENEDPFAIEEYYIENGVVFQKIEYSADEETLMVEQRTDIETGVLLYVSVIQKDNYINMDALIVLDQSRGIDIDTIVGNDDPTLSVPFSTFFVYTLIILPIVVSKYRKQKS